MGGRDNDKFDRAFIEDSPDEGRLTGAIERSRDLTHENEQREALDGPCDRELADQEREFREQLLDEANADLLLSEREGFENTIQGQYVLKNTPSATAYPAFRPSIEERKFADASAEREALRKNLEKLAAKQAEDDLSEAPEEMGGVEDELLDALEKPKENLPPSQSLNLESSMTEQVRATHMVNNPAPAAPTPSVGDHPNALTKEERKGEPAKKDPQESVDEFNRLGHARLEEEAAAAEREKEKKNETRTSDSKNRQKASDERTRMLGIGIAVMGAIVLAVLAAGYMFSDNKEKPQKNEAADEAKEMMKEMRQVSPSDLKGMKKRDESAPQENYGMPGDAKPEEKPTFAPSRSAGPGSRQASSGGPSKNFEKDRDIIEQYKNIDPAAAAAGGTVPEGSSLRYRPRPFAAGSTNDTKGGVTYTNQPSVKGGGDTGAFPLHDVQVRARLKFSIRSSASNQITAVSDADLDGLPAGAIFYGSGNFSNKRTYVQFNKVRTGDREFSIKAYAVSGKDPGIASEVIEIENNTKITFTSGVVDVTGKVLDNLAATATGGATSGVVNGTAGEVKDKNEQERARYEYRVGAGTGFIVYIE